jgi:hypothetical protein
VNLDRLSEIAPDLRIEIGECEGYGKKADFQADLDDVIYRIESHARGWWKAALWLYKIKLYKAWERFDLSRHNPYDNKPAGEVFPSAIPDGFASFRDFCERAIGRSVATVNAWIRAARTMGLLLAAGFDRLPKNATIALKLSEQPDEFVCDAWRDICAKYADHEITVERMKTLHDDVLNPDRPRFKNSRIPLDRYEVLREKAAEQGMTVAQFHCQILDHYLGTGHDTDPTTAKEPIDDRPIERVDAIDETLQIEPPIDHAGAPERASDGDGSLSSPPPSYGDVLESAPKPRTEIDREPASASRLKRMISSFRARPNPVRPRVCAIDGCDRSEELTACFNLVNRTTVADFYYCSGHLPESGYCTCGRWPTQCDCDRLEEF